jgi:hypothetical protein
MAFTPLHQAFKSGNLELGLAMLQTFQSATESYEELFNLTDKVSVSY